MADDFAERLLTVACTRAGRLFPHVSAAAPISPGIRAILMVKPCCIGDVIQTTPVIAALRSAFPLATIDLATTRWSRVAAESNPDLRAIVELPAAASVALPRLRRNWRARGYDLSVVLDRSPTYGTAAYLAGIPERAGYDSLGRGFALNRRVPVPKRVHELDLGLSVVEAMGLPIGCRIPTYHVVPDDHARASILLERRGIPRAAKFATLAPGGGTNPGAVMAEKRWRPEGFARIAERCIAEGMDVALIGGPSDAESASLVRRLARAKVHDLVGLTSFRELAAILQRSSLYVGNDSGTTHLAAAVGCPTVAIFGPTDPCRYGPRGARVTIVAAKAPPDDPGRGMVRAPWFSGRTWQSLVSVEEVWAAALGLGAAP